MSGSGSDRVDQHATEHHGGFPGADPEFEAVRAERAALVERFLTAMAAAGNPGVDRKLGSTVRQLTGQDQDEYWAVLLDSDDGSSREVTVFVDGRHGWSDEFVYSDRPRTAEDEITPQQLQASLDALLKANGLDWPEGDRPAPSGR